MIRPAADPWRAAAEQLAPGGRASGAYGYWRDPVAWMHDCIVWPAGLGPTIYQDEILGALHEYKRAAVRGCHGLGKTTLAALATLHFATTREGFDWKAATTASAWRQLDYYLWPEIHKWARRIRWEKLGLVPWRLSSELLQMNIKLRTGHAYAAASDDPATIEGAHADHLLYVFDEAKAIPEKTWDAAEGAFSGAGKDTTAEALALAISTPGGPGGRFYDIHMRRPGYEDWWVRHVTIDEAIAAGRVSNDWVEARRRQWGEKSALFQNRVLGNFAAVDADGVIPLTWAEEAMERHSAFVAEQRQWPGAFVGVGVDVAAFEGQAHSVLALRTGAAITELRDLAVAETMETTGHVAAVLRGAGAGYAHVDVIGPGAGVHSRLQELGFQSHGFNAGARTDQTDLTGELLFTNRRSAAWWMMRELLDPANGYGIMLPADDMLLGELVAPGWRMVSGGRVQVESKDTIVTRLGRSTDRADAVVMIFALVDDEPDQYVVYDQRVAIGPRL